MYKHCVSVNSGGWRNVAADGENEVSADVFVASKKFCVSDSQKVAFETAVSSAVSGGGFSSTDSSNDDVLFCNLLRRDADKSDDGYNYSLLLFFTGKSAFEAFSKSTAHASVFGADGSLSSFLGDKGAADVFYEGKLALFSSDMLMMQ